MKKDVTRAMQRRRNLGLRTVECPAAIAATLKIIAAWANERQPDTLTRLLGPVLDAEMKRLAARP